METLYVALDFKTEAETFDFLKLFEGRQIGVKVGMSQFYMSGPSIIERLCDMGHEVFLDLKCHDIPNTVYLAMLQLSQLPIELVTIHAMGGKEMMRAAVKGVQEGKHQPKVLAITHLTSTNQEMLNNQLQIPGTVAESVEHLTRLALDSGVDGLVSSVQESKMIKEVSKGQLLSLTPGIRLNKNAHDDQERIASPEEARANGADYIVVGRPIIQADDPVRAYEEMKEHWEGK